MIIEISPDLKSQKIYANGNELASIMGKDRINGRRVLTYPLTKKEFVCEFKNPVLLTDSYELGKLPPTLRDTLFALYNSRPRIVEYDKVSVLWNEKYKTVWCPSIDTILFAKALRKIKKKLKKVKTAIEIGCGSGFLSKYLLEKNKNIKSIVINDLNSDAILCAKDNIQDKRAIFKTGNGLELIKDKKFDLIICNPPYVPRPNSIHDNPYEGVELLNHFLNKAQDYLNPNGILITNISNLCEALVLKDKPFLKLISLEKMRVPLKVNNILNNKKWLNYLKKLGLKKDYKRGYEYWQEINIVMMKK